MAFGNRESPTMSASFGVTFRMMFREEWRQNVDFARKRHIMMFPIMLALLITIMTVGLRYLTGEVLINAEGEQQSFSWDQLKSYMHGAMFMFSLSMGSFAFLGRVMTSQRAGGKNYLLAAPAMHPLDLSTNYFAYYCKEVCYYILMLLIPAVAGMSRIPPAIHATVGLCSKRIEYQTSLRKEGKARGERLSGGIAGAARR